MIKPKLNKLFWAGIFVMITGLIFIAAGLPSSLSVAIACVGCGLAPFGFLISIIYFLVWLKNKKEYARRLISEKKRKIKEIETKKAKMAEKAKDESNRKARDVKRRHSGVIWSSKVEKMSSLLHELVGFTEKGYSLNSRQINELCTLYQYVKRDYEWFKSKKDKAPTIEWEALDNNIEAAKILIGK